MAKHFIRIVEDGTLATDDGWVIAREGRSGALFFIAEKSALLDQEVLNEAWEAVRELVVEQAVDDGVVRWSKPQLAVS